MNRTLFLATLIVAASSCIVPVDIKSNDAGARPVDINSNDSGAMPDDAGWTLPCGQNVDTFVGTTFTVPSGCPSGALTLLGPDGGALARSGESVTTSEPGVYLLEDEQGERTFVHVDGLLTGGFTRTYADRIDRCWKLLVSDGSRLVCNVIDIGMATYEPDGGRGALTLLPSPREVPASVAGSVLWVINNGGLERYSESESGWHFDGRNEHSSVVGQLTHMGDMRRDRGVLSGWDGTFVFSWDGGSLDVTEEFPLVPFTEGVAFVEDGGIYNVGFCTVRAGCEMESCSPVVTCPSTGGVIVGTEADVLWVYADYPNVTLQLWNRPLAGPQPLTPKRSLNNEHFVEYQPFVMGGFLPTFLDKDKVAAVPILQNGSFYYGYRKNVVAVGDHFIVSMEDPFTLRFIPR